MGGWTLWVLVSQRLWTLMMWMAGGAEDRACLDHRLARRDSQRLCMWMTLVLWRVEGQA